MTNEQLYLVIGAPMLFNAVLIGLLLAYINAKFDAVNQQFKAIDQRETSGARSAENPGRRNRLPHHNKSRAGLGGVGGFACRS